MVCCASTSHAIPVEYVDEAKPFAGSDRPPAASGRTANALEVFMNYRVLVAAVVVLSMPAVSSAQQPASAKMSEKIFAIPKDKIRSLTQVPGAGFATDRIMVEGKKIGYMYREAAKRPEDTGWRFFSGDEDQAYLNDLDHTGVYSINTIANYDPDVVPYLGTSAPCAFEKIEGTNKYRRVTQ